MITYAVYDVQSTGGLRECSMQVLLYKSIGNKNNMNFNML